MAEQQITDVIKNIYAMWATGDPQAIPVLMEHLSEDIKWCSLANGCAGVEFTREGNCKANVMQYFTGLVAQWEMVHFTVDEFVCERDRVVMLGKCSFLNRKSGKLTKTPKIDTIRVKNGLIVEFNEYYDTAGMLAAAQYQPGGRGTLSRICLYITALLLRDQPQRSSFRVDHSRPRKCNELDRGCLHSHWHEENHLLRTAM